VSGSGGNAPAGAARRASTLVDAKHFPALPTTLGCHNGTSPWPGPDRTR
jgi:hypothetical protein